MKFIRVKSVVEAYKGFQDCMTNKSWGYLALLKGCKSSISKNAIQVVLSVLKAFCVKSE